MKSNPKARSLARKNILQVITGSIAAYKAGDLVSLLREEGAQVTCVMTPSAKHFVTPLVLRALSGGRVYDDFFSAETEYDIHSGKSDNRNGDIDYQIFTY